MEEKRKDAGNQPTASSAAAATVTPTKLMEASPAAEPPSSRRRGGQKRKASNINGGNASTPTTTSSKRQAREKPSAVTHAPIHNGPFTRARQSPATPSDAAMNSEAEAVAPPGTGGREAVRTAEETGREEAWEALEAKIEAEYAAIRSRDSNAHVVPIPAGWFSWTAIHPLEEQVMPSFFNGKSEKRTPEIYREIRNWIMRKFHANPNTLIELKDLSELSVGELDVKQEVMEFLDHWGLINYHPFPDSDSAMLNADGDVPSKTDSLIEKLYQFEAEQSSAPVVPRTNVMTSAAPSRLFPESSVADELLRSEGPDVEYHCNSCSADCSRKRYHCQKQADFDLCTECFNNGKFDSDMSPMDFIIMEPAEAAGVSGGKWTDQETLLLLEALELYKENWNEIAEHVATKTKAQCILHFIQMPIEDTFMDCDDEIDARIKENADPTIENNDSSAPKGEPETMEGRIGADENLLESAPVEISKPDDASEVKVGQETDENCALKALKEAFEAVGSFPTPGGRFSFADAGNPVMTLAAFLARLVEPNAATALVRSSLKSISGNSSSVQLAARHCFLLQDPPSDEKKSADSERNVTEMVEKDAQKNEENQIEENSNSVLDSGDLPKDHDKEKNKDYARDECIEKSAQVMGTREEEGLISSNKSDKPDFPNDLATRDGKASDDVAPKAEIHQNSAKESSDKTSDESGKPDLPIDTEERSAKESEDDKPKEEIPSTSAEGPGDRTSEEGPSHSAETAKRAVVDPDSLPLEKKKPDQLITSNSVAGSEINTGVGEAKDCNNQNQDPSETKDQHNIDNMKRAAVTALSAAAVKAKLLADQEEDQIRQLATLLIQKQLHKLETKLAFFTEMESVVMRVREQMERSKQRLYQERAQIIASRLGFSAQSSRPTQQSLPINRVAMGFANSAAKPPMVMTSQRPPILRSSVTAGLPPPSNAFSPATSAGNPVRPTNQDKIPFATK
ncbi:SWI/SNF complex subunit SWI3D [Actinidia eriantha]|uniref:SWI/SNF complex subunit SWI3D n=1 Tax=Actinidia eriantha TaxID=165200 RepID=UPI002586AF00|nr:SWI/SNF complex subunit SWI3D [Actinidia eriantha]